MVKTAPETNPLSRNEKNKARTCAARKDCIKRKTRELSILCGTTACSIIVGPNGEVNTWPENPKDVKSIIDMYRKNKNDPRVKKNPQPSAYPGTNTSLNEFLSGWKDDWLRGLSRDILGNFVSDLESKRQAIESRIDALNEMNYEQRNPQQGKSTFPHNDNAPLVPLQEVHSSACACCYHPVYVQALNWYRAFEENEKIREDYAQQFFPTTAIYSHPVVLDEGLIGLENVNPVQLVAPAVVEGSLNGHGDLDQHDEISSNYCRQFSPLDW